MTTMSHTDRFTAREMFADFCDEHAAVSFEPEDAALTHDTIGNFTKVHGQPHTTEEDGLTLYTYEVSKRRECLVMDFGEYRLALTL